MSRSRTHDVDDVDFDIAEGDAPAQDTEPLRPATGRTRTFVTLAIVAVVVIGVGLAAGQTTKPQKNGDVITEVFSQGEPCATVVLDVQAPAGSNPTQVAETLFGELRKITGMNTATYNAATGQLNAGFCESTTSETALREALAPTGLVAEVTPRK